MTNPQDLHNVFLVQPISTIHSPFMDPASVPIQVARSSVVGRVSVFPQFVDGLEHLEVLFHIFLLYVFHRATGFELEVKPSLDDLPRLRLEP